MAVAATKLCGLKDSEIYKSVKKVKDVNGRLEFIRQFPNNIKVFIDYAHTPDALKNVLQTINSVRTKNENLITVVGCGGERDQGKRPKMAAIAARLSGVTNIIGPGIGNQKKWLTVKYIQFILLPNISVLVNKVLLWKYIV